MNSKENHPYNDEFDENHLKKKSNLEKRKGKQKNKKWIRDYEIEDEDDDELTQNEEE